MRRLLSTALFAFLAAGCLGLAGCHYRSTHDIYYLVAPNLKLSYWKSVQAGFQQAAHEYGVTPVVAGPETYDPSAEASAFSDAVGRHPAGILVSAAAASALHADIASAIDSGIPVITVDSDAPNSERLYFIGTNNLGVGHLGGQRVVERLHGKGNVIFYSIPGQPNLDERMKGYEEIFSNSPGIRVVGVVSTAGESGNAFDQTEQYVHRTGADKIDAFICLESEAGKAVAEVLKRNNLTDRELIAMDVDPETLNLIAAGTIDATVSQRPYTMGYVGLKALDDAHRAPHTGFNHDYSVNFRSPFPYFVDTGSALITKDNVSIYQHTSDSATQ
ncbi:MAG TPA: substrate-binding domain-containing protein [Acidobacteriaceae bacterium]|nr:substrate-binding domain-containing protein [Acidobacteriaceae bacterium]